MRYLSLCSGIEGATVAWEPLGWQPIAFSETDAFCRALLQHHYPDVSNMGDMRYFRGWDIEPGAVDLIVGGTPCQSFSVAGLRKGLDDPRGDLALIFLGVVDALHPKWVVWENVPGVLSVERGRAFGAFLGGLAQLGYGFAYRVLDAQYFGLAQRRRRVYVVGCLGDWRGPAAVLLERESLSGDHPPSREAGEEVAGTVTSRTSAGGGLGTDFECAGGLQVTGQLMGSGAGADRAAGLESEADYLARHTPLAFNIQQNDGGKHRRKDRPEGGLYVNETDRSLAVGTTDRTVVPRMSGVTGDGRGRRIPIIAIRNAGRDSDTRPGRRGVTMQDDLMFTLQGEQQHALLVDGAEDGSGKGAPFVAQVQWDSGGGKVENPTVQTLRANAGHSYQFARIGMGLRRLTPRECERLQGFPDDWTMIPYRGKPAEACPDSPRYRSLGNAFAVPVIGWIGERIQLLESTVEGE